MLLQLLQLCSWTITTISYKWTESLYAFQLFFSGLTFLRMEKVTFVTGVKNLKSYNMQITNTQLYRVVIGANKMQLQYWCIRSASGHSKAAAQRGGNDMDYNSEVTTMPMCWATSTRDPVTQVAATADQWAAGHGGVGNAITSQLSGALSRPQWRHNHVFY